MSIPVQLDALEAKTTEFGWAYLLTVNEDQTPKIVATTLVWDDGELTADVGGGSVRNVSARPTVTVAYPPLDPSDYTLIVDGTARAVTNDESITVRFAPTGAVLHRAAPAGFTGSATGCSNDCAPVTAAPSP